MKRAPELQPLSREHRDALIVARRLRRAAEGLESLSGALALLDRAWRAQIQPHFRIEEEALLPAFAAAAGADNTLIVRTLTGHIALRLAVRQIRGGAQNLAELDGSFGRP